MALAAATVWEVRPTNGVDTNGGGFVAGSTGTDWSQQNAAQYAVADAVTNNTTTVTSATANFGTDVVGNIVYLTGTGTTTGWYQIISRTNATTIVVDRATGSTGGTGVTLNIGGALKTLTQLAAVMVGSNKAFVKAEATITTTASFTFGAAGVTPSETVPMTRLYGYTTTRGDFGQVSITLSTNSSLTALSLTNAGWCVDGFNINCASLASSNGIIFGGAYSEARNCKIANFANNGIGANNTSSHIHHCEVTGGTSAAQRAIQVAGTGVVTDCWVHDNACPGIMQSGSGSSTAFVKRNVVSNNTGASSDGIQCAAGCVVESNAVYKNGRHGIYFTGVINFPDLSVRNNVVTDHTAAGAAGFKSATAAIPADPRYDGNFFFNNTSHRVNVDDTATNAIDNVTPYTNTFDVVLTATPWTNAAGNDYTINNTAGGGALVRAKGLPGTGGTLYSGIPGLTTSTGYLDGGVFQHKDPPGAAPGVIMPPQPMFTDQY